MDFVRCTRYNLYTNLIGDMRRNSERYRTAIEIIKMLVSKLLFASLVEDTSSFQFADSNVMISLHLFCVSLSQILSECCEELSKISVNLSSAVTSNRMEVEGSIYTYDKYKLRFSLHVIHQIWRLLGENNLIYNKIFRLEMFISDLLNKNQYEQFDILQTIVRDKELAKIINHDIGYKLLSIGGHLHLLDIISVQHLINLFITIANSNARQHQSFVELFFRQVYLKNLYYSWLILCSQVSFNKVKIYFMKLEIVIPLA